MSASVFTTKLRAEAVRCKVNTSSPNVVNIPPKSNPVRVLTVENASMSLGTGSVKRDDSRVSISLFLGTLHSPCTTSRSTRPGVERAQLCKIFIPLRTSPHAASTIIDVASSLIDRPSALATASTCFRSATLLKGAKRNFMQRD